MPAKSIKQQGLFGVALSVKKGDKKLSDIEPEYREKIKSIVDRMTKKSINDFASTKHKKLPVEVKEKILKEEYKRETQKTIPPIITQLKPESNKASTKNKMSKMQNLVDYRDFITKTKKINNHE